MVRGTRFVLLAVVLLLTVFAFGQTNRSAAPVAPVVAQSASAGSSFDVHAAVEVYLAKMPPAERARSNAYFEAAIG